MNYIEFRSKYPNIQLNEQQEMAVQAVEGPVLLLAVPGSGKTTVLVTRIGYMIECMGIDPAKILTLTYTRAATIDMKERFKSFFGEELARELEFRTINGICARIIADYAKMYGREAFELETDESKLLEIISKAYQRYENSFPTASDLKDVKTQITYIKNMALEPEQIEEYGEKSSVSNLLHIYNAYCDELKVRHKMDYDDQMRYALIFLKNMPELRLKYQEMYPYILVDEAQDTSKIQHQIIEILGAKSKNVFMVGDEDQSIYGFRAAYPKALFDFERTHENARVLLMENNYRSNAKIVEAADQFIQKSKDRHPKHIKATKPAGAEIRDIKLNYRSEQYSYLLKVAEKCKADGSEVAVLYRNNESIIPLVDGLDRAGISYRAKDAEISFFSNRVVVDIKAILAFADDLTNTALFENIYYKINTYLKRDLMLEACRISRDDGCTVFDAIYEHIELPDYQIEKLMELERHLRGLRARKPLAAIDTIVNTLGYGDHIKQRNLSMGKVDILREIAKNQETILDFLQRLEDLRGIISNSKKDAYCSFILSTIHGSKGLEYDNVYLLDVYDGLFPEDTSSVDYEEERRLFYVGITRAKERLNVFKTLGKSTFVEELLPDRYSTASSSGASALSMRGPAGVPVINASVHAKKDAEPFDEKGYEEFKKRFVRGAAIKHKTRGAGKVLNIDGDIAICIFDKRSMKYNIKTLFEKQLVEII